MAGSATTPIEDPYLYADADYPIEDYVSAL
jgi:hypothetical protein